MRAELCTAVQLFFYVKMLKTTKKISSWFHQITLLGNCFLCNKEIRIWNRSGNVLEKIGDANKLYRALLCREHYEGYFNFSGVRSLVAKKIRLQIKMERTGKLAKAN
jgi:hypothetical protein